MNAVSAVFKFINLPLANWAVTKFDGNFFWPNFIYTVGLLPCFVLSWKMGKISKKEKEVEQFVCFNCRVKQETTVVRLSRRVSISLRPSTIGDSVAALGQNTGKGSTRRCSVLSVSVLSEGRRSSALNAVSALQHTV